MKNSQGLTIIEVIVAMTLLAILGAALISMLPMLTSNTRAATLDTTQSQRAIAVFEDIAHAWTNSGAWNNETVKGGQTVTALVQARLGTACDATISTPTAERKRVIITCEQDGNLPARTLRAEFGDPGA